jgi:hypothetical protein
MRLTLVQTRDRPTLNPESIKTNLFSCFFKNLVAKLRIKKDVKSKMVGAVRSVIFGDLNEEILSPILSQRFDAFNTLLIWWQGK